MNHDCKTPSTDSGHGLSHAICKLSRQVFHGEKMRKGLVPIVWREILLVRHALPISHVQFRSHLFATSPFPLKFGAYECPPLFTAAALSHWREHFTMDGRARFCPNVIGPQDCIALVAKPMS